MDITLYLPIIVFLMILVFLSVVVVVIALLVFSNKKGKERNKMDLERRVEMLEEEIKEIKKLNT